MESTHETGQSVSAYCSGSEEKAGGNGCSGCGKECGTTGIRDRRDDYLNEGISLGKPTRIKNRANACEKCSTQGESRVGRGPAARVNRVR